MVALRSYGDYSTEGLIMRLLRALALVYNHGADIRPDLTHILSEKGL